MAQPGGPSPEQMQQMRQQFLAQAKSLGMTPQEFQNHQMQQLAAEAKKAGLTPEQYMNQMKQKAFEEHQRKLAQAQQGAQGEGNGQAGQPKTQKVEVQAGAPPKPEALAVAKFLRSQDLKTRICILDGQRKDMFKVKRAFRALRSPAYQKARSKNPLLPEVSDDASARNTVQLLPMSMLALRVTKSDPHEGHDHAPRKDPKRVKGLWTVKVEREQDFDPMMHYVWFYEGPQWKRKVMAGGALILLIALVMFPLWPIVLRQGVWYLSVGMMGLIGLFFVMAIFRLILFCATVFTVPPGLWLYPNLFEDVGFFDSFRPLWGWQETKKKGKKSSKGDALVETPRKSASSAKTTGSDAALVARKTGPATHRAPQVEEADDSD